MAYVYGDILCATAHDWVYGEILCVTLPTEDEVKPTEPWVRVSSLTHIWTPGTYLLMIGLGDLTSDFVMPDVTTKGPREVITPDGDYSPVIPAPGGCTVGEKKCIGPHLYQCVPVYTDDPWSPSSYNWLIIAYNSDNCR